MSTTPPIDSRLDQQNHQEAWWALTKSKEDVDASKDDGDPHASDTEDDLDTEFVFSTTTEPQYIARLEDTHDYLDTLLHASRGDIESVIEDLNLQRTQHPYPGPRIRSELRRSIASALLGLHDAAVKPHATAAQWDTAEARVKDEVFRIYMSYYPDASKAPTAGLQKHSKIRADHYVTAVKCQYGSN